MSKALQCNRTRLVTALFLCVLFCGASPAAGCSFDRMVHVKHQSECFDNCFYVNVLGDGKTVDLIATDNVQRSLRAIHLSALTSLNHNQVKRPILLNQPVLVESQSGLLSGCRYGYIDYGNAHGARDGSVVIVRLQTTMTAAFRILRIEDQQVFGVYDAQEVKVDHI